MKEISAIMSGVMLGSLGYWAASHNALFAMASGALLGLNIHTYLKMSH